MDTDLGASRASTDCVSDASEVERISVQARLCGDLVTRAVITSSRINPEPLGAT
jgi:hypothetical protein